LRSEAKSAAKRDRMIEQEKVGKARIIGYGIGLAVFVVVAIWKFLVH
jgi:hypothetical protein